MTKPESRELIGKELVLCIAEHLDKLPPHIKIDSKGTKKYISFKDFEVYVCFYVTSSLYYSIWKGGVKVEDVPALLYDRDRRREEAQAMVRAAFCEALNHATNVSFD